MRLGARYHHGRLDPIALHGNRARRRAHRHTNRSLVRWMDGITVERTPVFKLDGRGNEHVIIAAVVAAVFLLVLLLFHML